MGRRRRRAGAAGLTALVATLGCAACAGPDPDGALQVALRLEAALAAGDGAGVCDLLLPAAAEQVEDATRTSCAAGVADLVDGSTSDPAAAAATRSPRVAVAGRQAQVVLVGDTVFLARDGDGWVVTAALCAPRADRPYDCEVQAS